MYVSKLEKTWKLMKRIDFEIGNDISSEMLCIICGKILINACNGPCGCRYCRGCIVNYLENGDKFCPGGQTFCHDEIISIDRNVQIDQAINSKIFRIVVKCPQSSCEFQGEVRKIENHLRLCKAQNTSCPYCNIGCKHMDVVDEKLNEHLLSENNFHSKLLIEWIENLSNEIGQLKKDISCLKNENSFLKEEIQLAKSQNSKPNGLMKSSSQQQIPIFPNRFQFSKVESEVLEEKEEKLQTNANAKTNENPHETDDSDIASLSHIGSVRTKHMKLNSWKIKGHHKKHNRGEFVWVIEKFSERRQDQKNGTITSISSHPFYSYKDGYKMCLTIHPNGILDGAGTHLSIGFCLLQGHFDSILQWPFKHDVVLSLINQKTGRTHTSKTKKYNDMEIETERTMPTSDKHVGIGFSQFIKLSHLLKDTSLYHKDRIIIRCFVNVNK